MLHALRATQDGRKCAPPCLSLRAAALPTIPPPCIRLVRGHQVQPIFSQSRRQCGSLTVFIQLKTQPLTRLGLAPKPPLAPANPPPQSPTRSLRGCSARRRSLFGLLAVGLFLLLWSRSEPSYGGQRISAWITQLDDTGASRRQEAQTALQRLGSKGPCRDGPAAQPGRAPRGQDPARRSIQWTVERLRLAAGEYRHGPGQPRSSGCAGPVCTMHALDTNVEGVRSPGQRHFRPEPFSQRQTQLRFNQPHPGPEPGGQR
jgi:hypothetical protein